VAHNARWQPGPSRFEKNADGQWFFDTAAGRDEVLLRRIGRNEPAIIGICEAVADAQAEYYFQMLKGQTDKAPASFSNDWLPPNLSFGKLMQ
jgi:hypothetical protein